MAGIYGHKWTAGHGDSDIDGTWAAGLAEITPEEIGAGLSECVKSGESWPPSLPEFRAMCRPQKQSRENAAMYHCPPSHQLPKLATDEEKQRGREALAKIKAGIR